MSRRRNGTNRAAAQLGINPYGWGSGGKRKRPGEMGTPVGAHKNTLTASVTEKESKCNG